MIKSKSGTKILYSLKLNPNSYVMLYEIHLQRYTGFLLLLVVYHQKMRPKSLKM